MIHLDLVMLRWWFGKVLNTFEICVLMLNWVVIHLLLQNFYVISAVVGLVAGHKQVVWDLFPTFIYQCLW